MSLKKIFLKSKLSYKVYLYYNLYIRHKGFLKREKYSQWGEDKFIAEYFKDKDKGIYLDIGCFNPFMYSNTCLLHKKGWSGINIDISKRAIDLNKVIRKRDINLNISIGKEEKIIDSFIFYDNCSMNTVDKKFKESIISKIPANRLGKPEDIANAVLFLASSGSDYINGETLHVNGGMYLG